MWDPAGSMGQADSAPFQRQLTVEQLVTALEDDNWTIVNARTTDSYNGWKLSEIEQGGHIDGAVDFPADWLQIDVFPGEAQLNTVLRTKQIIRSRKIVVYSIDFADRQRVGQFLRQEGFPEIYSFDLRDWLASGRVRWARVRI